VVRCSSLPAIELLNLGSRISAMPSQMASTNTFTAQE
jgi:hypothetical protein